MPRRLLGIFLLLLVLVPGVRAQGDVVLLTIGNDSVSSREFEYHFNRSQEKHADVFAETYGRFKQKVQCARALGLDTLDTFRQQVKMFWERAKDVSADNPLSFTKEREWIKLKLLTWPLRQSDGKEKQREGIQKMDSLYAALQNGADVQAEELPWVQTRHLLAEWQKQLKVLSQNEFSRPFFSPMGIHLIAWKEKMSGRTSGGAVADTDNLFRQKGMEDALLALALERSLDERLVCTEQGLEEYFKQHHARYGYGTPHFRGAVVHCRDKKAAKTIKKYLKKYPESLWKEAVERMPEEMAGGCRLETGLFAIGANPYVDKLVFKCGDFNPPADYPYTWVLGKKLKKGPADYKDVRDRLEKDYRAARKETELEAMMNKYGVEINKEVLKTVNRAGNK